MPIWLWKQPLWWIVSLFPNIFVPLNGRSLLPHLVEWQPWPYAFVQQNVNGSDVGHCWADNVNHHLVLSSLFSFWYMNSRFQRGDDSFTWVPDWWNKAEDDCGWQTTWREINLTVSNFNLGIITIEWLRLTDISSNLNENLAAMRLILITKSIWELWKIGSRPLEQWSPTFLALGTGFLEDSFSMCAGGKVQAVMWTRESDGERQMKFRSLTCRSPPVRPGSQQAVDQHLSAACGFGTPALEQLKLRTTEKTVRIGIFRIGVLFQGWLKPKFS